MKPTTFTSFGINTHLSGLGGHVGTMECKVCVIILY